MISIGIPVYEMGGQGVSFLDYCLGTIYPQTFSDYEIVISDHSKNDEIKLYCQDKPKVKYFRNEHGRGFLGPNFNNVIRNCTGDIIKFMQQDDFFLNQYSLEKTVEAFGEFDYWMMSAYWHSFNRTEFFKYHLPKVSQNLALINLLGCPTALTIKNRLDVWFDETLKYFVDSDFYYKLQLKYGDPVIMEEPTTAQLLWSGQTTNSIITQEILDREYNYLVDKYVTKKIT